MVDFQPAYRSSNRGCASTDTGAVPHPGTSPRNANVFAPMQQVGRLGEPDIVAANLRTGRAMQCKITAANFFIKQNAILVMRRKDKTMFAELPPVRRGAHAHRDTVRRNRSVGQVVSVIKSGNATILKPESLAWAATMKRRVNLAFTEAHTIFTRHQPQMRERRQIMHPII